MKEKEIIVGIDVSKSTLDVCVLLNGQSESYALKNNTQTVTSFFKRLLKKNPDRIISVCMEHTGYYNWPSLEAFDQLTINLYVVNPLHLKKSMGLVRGKTDVLDAARIAKFIALHKEELSPTLIARKQIRMLQVLVAQRNRLVETRKRLSVPTEEVIFLGDKEISKTIEQSSKRIIEALDKQLQVIETEINQIIHSDDQLKKNFEFVTSVQGVGKVLAWTMIIKTNEFKSINDARKLACYAGVVPFGYQSGTSINRKPRVSSMADKTLKKLLHLCAMRAIQLKGDLQTYYKRKVEEGKNKMLVLNAIRNKIIARVCATVKNQRKYEINFQPN